MGMLGIVAAGILGVACNQPEKQASSPPTSQKGNLPAQESRLATEKEAAPPPAAVRALESPPLRAQRNQERMARELAKKRRFAQRLEVRTPIPTLRVSQVVTIPVTVKNMGREPWLTEASPSGERPVKLWYHWIDWPRKTATPGEQISAAAGEEKKKSPRARRAPRKTSVLRKRGQVVEFGGMRTPLPHEVRPQETVHVAATVKAPSRPGEFLLRLTMMREGEGSFENKGGMPLDIPVTVTP